MQNRALKLIYIVFSAVWMIIIFTEYWRYNPNYSKSIELFQYYDLLIIFLGLGSGLTWFIRKPRNKPIKYVNGLSIFCFLLFLDVLAINRFTVKESGLNFTLNGVLSHWGHIIGLSISLLLIYLLIRVIGSIITSLFSPKIAASDLPLIQIALGIMAFTGMLFMLGTIGALTPFIIIPICLIILGLYWRHTFYFFKSTLLTPITIPKNLNALGVFSFLFLGIYLIMNFAQILRPFPIGADSLRVYVNLPNLIAEYGALVIGHQFYNWSLFMSSGLVIFGRIDVVLGISFLGGVFSLLALYQLSKKYLDINYSALGLLAFYSLPMVNFLSYMDMKVDMGLLFYTLTTLLLYYNWLKPSLDEGQAIKGIGLNKAQSFLKDKTPNILKENRLLVLIGLLSGFAFGIKLTVLFFVMSLFCTIWFVKGSKLTFLASFCLCFAAVLILKLDDQPALRQFHDNVGRLKWSLLLLSIILIAYAFIKQKKKLIQLLSYSLIIGFSFALPTLPWLTKNFSETHSLSVHSLLNGKNTEPTFDAGKLDPNEEYVIIPGIYQMPALPEKTKENLKLEEDKSSEKTRKDIGAETKAERRAKRKAKKKNKKKPNERHNSGISEDLHRFMGYEAVPIRYLSIPYDVFIKTNVPGFFIDVGFLLLLFFPTLFLFPNYSTSDWKSRLSKLAFMGLSFILLLISIPSAYLNQKKLTTPEEGLTFINSNPSSGIIGQLSDIINTNSLHFYTPIYDRYLSNFKDSDSFTYPLLIALFAFIVLIVAIRIKNHSRDIQSLVIFLLMYFFLWWMFGAGASWYGIMLFCVPFIFLLKNISDTGQQSKTINNKFNFLFPLKKTIFLSCAMIWVMMSFTHRAANFNPFNKATATRLYYPPITKYSMGEINEKKLMDYNFPNVRNFVRPINKDKKSLVYMIGSPYMYFIDRNDTRILNDLYLDFFNLLVQKHKTKAKIISTLKDKGIRYLVFDLSMASYDVTPGKTLTRKFTNLLNTLYANPGVELLSTDRKIKLHSNGKEVFEVFQDKGTIVSPGTIAIFKIK